MTSEWRGPGTEPLLVSVPHERSTEVSQTTTRIRFLASPHLTTACALQEFLTRKVLTIGVRSAAISSQCTRYGFGSTGIITSLIGARSTIFRFRRCRSGWYRFLRPESTLRRGVSASLNFKEGRGSLLTPIFTNMCLKEVRRKGSLLYGFLVEIFLIQCPPLSQVTKSVACSAMT